MTRNQLAKTKTAAQEGIAFKPGYIVNVEITAKGGTSYQRTDLREEEIDKRLEAEFNTVKRVDNVDIHKESQAITNAAYYALEKFCTQTPIGYFADDKQLSDLKDSMVEVRESAEIFNRLARQVGSARRVTVEIFPLKLLLDTEGAAIRLARSVRERLVEARTALYNGDRKGYEVMGNRLRNLDRLATGIQADAVRLALESLKEQKGELLKLLREGGDIAQSGAKLNLEAVDAAIALFTTPQTINEEG
jgi:hypothetical protein